MNQILTTNQQCLIILQSHGPWSSIRFNGHDFWPNWWDMVRNLRNMEVETWENHMENHGTK